MSAKPKCVLSAEHARWGPVNTPLLAFLYVEEKLPGALIS